MNRTQTWQIKVLISLDYKSVSRLLPATIASRGKKHANYSLPDLTLLIPSNNNRSSPSLSCHLVLSLLSQLTAPFNFASQMKQITPHYVTMKTLYYSSEKRWNFGLTILKTTEEWSSKVDSLFVPFALFSELPQQIKVNVQAAHQKSPEHGQRDQTRIFNHQQKVPWRLLTTPNAFENQVSAKYSPYFSQTLFL